MIPLRALAAVLVIGLLTPEAFAQPAAPVKPPPLPEKFKAFEKMMTNAKLVGQFTVLGRENGKGRQEEYLIKSVKKLPQGNLWVFHARVKYGKRDLTLPMPLPVKWAGDTPVITLDETTIPGLGTFSCRVIFHDGQYVGIWKHGKVGGQMFGTIVKEVETDTPPKQ